jgi:hypothetical protein
MTELCRLCGANPNFVMTGLVLQKYKVRYFDCPTCGYVQTEKPYWLAEAYEQPINKYDTGIISRNYQNSILVYFLSLLMFRLKYKKIRHVDYAGGYGILVGLLREFGITSHWHDKYCKNVFADQFPWDGNKSVDLLSAFEVFEHFENPNLEIGELLAHSKNIIFSTRLISDEIPKIGEWWYYGEEHGQHIGFYRKKTLQFVAKKNHLNLLSDGVAIHCLSEMRPSLMLFKMACAVSRVNMLSMLKKI